MPFPNEHVEPLEDTSEGHAVPRVLEAIYTTPWAITPSALQTIITIAQRANPSPEAVAAELGRPLDNTRRVTVRQGVATIPIVGPLFRYANLFSQISGATSFEVFARDLTQALENPQVKAILLAVDSPGGEVNGTQETARLIFDARNRKPVVAHISGFGASAAYWLASAASEVSVSATALVGSIGVIMADHRRTDGAIEEVEIVSSQSPKKPMDLFTDEGRARIQAVVDRLAEVFIADVATFRGVSRKTVLADFGQGDLFVGADAVSAGLTDRLETHEEAHARLAARAEQRGARLVASEQIAAEWAPVAWDALAASANLEPTLAACLDAGILPHFALTCTGGSSATPPPAPTMGAQKEDRTVSDHQDTLAAPQGADDLQAFRERLSQIKTLCAAAGCPERAVDLAESEKSIAAISAELLEDVRQKTPTPPLAPPSAEKPNVAVGAERELDAPYTLGDQLQMVARATQSKFRTIDKRLVHLHGQFAAASGLSEEVPADGGFLIHPQFVPGLRDRIYATGSILGLLTRTPIGANANGIKRNMVDETDRANGSRFGGLRAYWGAEAGTLTGSRPKFRRHEQELEKLHVLMYATDELLQDAVALEADVNRMVPQELRFVAEDAIINGTGVGQPLGVMSSAALVSQAKETSQTAATINVANLAKMDGRLFAGVRNNNRAWLINQDAINQLRVLVIGDQPVYITTVRDGVGMEMLFGAPVLPIEYAATLGTQGDILLGAWGEYELIEKGGIRGASSMHVAFLTDEMAFRWTWRLNGQPFWNNTLTPFKGTNTQSPFIALDTRA